MQKYLKIIQEDFLWLAKFRTGCEIHFPRFRKACDISYRVRNSFFTVLLSVLQLVLLLGISHSHAKLLDVRFLLWFSSLHAWLIWKRLWSSPKLGFFMCLSFNLLFHGLCKILPHSWFVLMIKKLSKTQKFAKNWLETFARVFNVPIELKGNKYYSKVFKIVYDKI